MIAYVLSVPETQQLGMSIAVPNEHQETRSISVEDGYNIGGKAIKIGHVFHRRLWVSQSETTAAFKDHGIADPVRGPRVADVLLL